MKSKLIGTILVVSRFLASAIPVDNVPAAGGTRIVSRPDIVKTRMAQLDIGKKEVALTLAGLASVPGVGLLAVTANDFAGSLVEYHAALNAEIDAASRQAAEQGMRAIEETFQGGAVEGVPEAVQAGATEAAQATVAEVALDGSSEASIASAAEAAFVPAAEEAIAPFLAVEAIAPAVVPEGAALSLLPAAAGSAESLAAGSAGSLAAGSVESLGSLDTVIYTPLAAGEAASVGTTEAAEAALGFTATAAFGESLIPVAVVALPIIAGTLAVMKITQVAMDDRVKTDLRRFEHDIDGDGVPEYIVHMKTKIDPNNDWMTTQRGTFSALWYRAGHEKEKSKVEYEDKDLGLVKNKMKGMAIPGSLEEELALVEIIKTPDVSNEAKTAGLLNYIYALEKAGHTFKKDKIVADWNRDGYTSTIKIKYKHDNKLKIEGDMDGDGHEDHCKIKLDEKVADCSDEIMDKPAGWVKNGWSKFTGLFGDHGH